MLHPYTSSNMLSHIWGRLVTLDLACKENMSCSFFSLFIHVASFLKLIFWLFARSTSPYNDRFWDTWWDFKTSLILIKEHLTHTIYFISNLWHLQWLHCLRFDQKHYNLGCCRSKRIDWQPWPLVSTTMCKNSGQNEQVIHPPAIKPYPPSSRNQLPAQIPMVSLPYQMVWLVALTLQM